jgi:membrane-associated phospholipid phosphatase
MSFTWWVHQLGNNSFDDFFIHFSALAEWALILAAASIALIRDWKRGLWMGLALGIQALLVVGIKSALNAPRPIEINAQLVRLIPHLEIHHWQAFPSGHTAVGFFTMGWLALNYPDKYNHKRMVAAILAILAIFDPFWAHISGRNLKKWCKLRECGANYVPITSANSEAFLKQKIFEKFF